MSVAKSCATCAFFKPIQWSGRGIPRNSGYCAIERKSRRGYEICSEHVQDAAKIDAPKRGIKCVVCNYTLFAHGLKGMPTCGRFTTLDNCVQMWLFTDDETGKKHITGMDGEL